jgi:hypothetical protein
MRGKMTGGDRGECEEECEGCEKATRDRAL